MVLIFSKDLKAPYARVILSWSDTGQKILRTKLKGNSQVMNSTVKTHYFFFARLFWWLLAALGDQSSSVQTSSSGYICPVYLQLSWSPKLHNAHTCPHLYFPLKSLSKIIEVMSSLGACINPIVNLMFFLVYFDEWFGSFFLKSLIENRSYACENSNLVYFVMPTPPPPPLMS